VRFYYKIRVQFNLDLHWGKSLKLKHNRTRFLILKSLQNPSRRRNLKLIAGTNAGKAQWPTMRLSEALTLREASFICKRCRRPKHPLQHRAEDRWKYLIQTITSFAKVQISYFKNLLATKRHFHRLVRSVATLWAQKIQFNKATIVILETSWSNRPTNLNPY
jgi:hypothetical protein